jgi:NADPH-dependent 7-cyano-7-deazaguanine reductase QueF
MELKTKVADFNKHRKFHEQCNGSVLFAQLKKENMCVGEKIVSVTGVICSAVCSEHRHLSGLTLVDLKL